MTEGQGFGVAVTLANGGKLFLAVGVAYDSSMETTKEASKLERWARRIVGIVVILGMIYSAYRFMFARTPGDPASAVTTCVILLIVYVVVNIDIFSAFEFGLSGLKIALREATQQVNATKEQVRALALNVAKVGMGLLPGDYLGGMPYPERLKLKNEIERTLLALGATDLETKDATKWFTDLFAAHHVYRILIEFFRPYPGPYTNKPVFGYTNFQVALRDFVSLSTGHRLNPKEVRRQLEKLSSPLTPEVEAELVDYQHFMDTGMLRRPEEWLPKDSR